MSGRVCRGDSGAVLGRLSHDAEMVVLGSPRRGPVVAGAGGTVRVARTSRAPVVMVSQKVRAQQRSDTERAPIAVILESATDGRRVVEWASIHAARERREVRVILTLRRRCYRRDAERYDAEMWLFDLLNDVRGRTRHFGLSGTTQQADDLARDALVRTAPLVVLGRPDRASSIRRWRRMVAHGVIRAVAVVPSAS